MQKSVVTVPVADLRAEPDHSSERVSQALYGFVVDVHKREGQFAYVRCDDGYSGWISEFYLSGPAGRDLETAVVSSILAEFRSKDSGDTLVLPHGSVLYGSGSGRFRRLVDNGEMALVSGTVTDQITVDPISIARQFVSIPYLWGGTSTYGFDCSGLVQAVFRRCGVILPRDTGQQCRRGREVSWERSRAGDLVFFPGHVALHLGARHIIHATRRRGVVAAESLDAEDPCYRDDLADRIVTVRRITVGRRKRRIK